MTLTTGYTRRHYSINIYRTEVLFFVYMQYIFQHTLEAFLGCIVILPGAREFVSMINLTD